MATKVDQVDIIHGEDKDITLDLLDEEGKPFDLTGNTEIKACFVNDDDTILSKLRTTGGITVSGDDKLGVIVVTVTKAESALLKAGVRQSFEVVVTDAGGKDHKAQFIGKLNIHESICP